MRLYLSHSDEVELMATFTPADVISVVRPGSWEVGEARTPAGSVSCPPAEVKVVYTNPLCSLVLGPSLQQVRRLQSESFSVSCLEWDGQSVLPLSSKEIVEESFIHKTVLFA